MANGAEIFVLPVRLACAGTKRSLLTSASSREKDN
jgi:hypothetical protein